MLIKISVKNFKSFDKETVLTMISSNKIRKLPEHSYKIKNTDLLKNAVIYGANAAGKSNLIEVFKFIKYCVKTSIPAQAVDLFSKNKEKNISNPSTFEIQFTINNTFYAYGFSIVLNQRELTSEWLYELHQNGSTKMLFEREGGKKPVVNEKSLETEDKKKLLTYLDDFDETSNRLFLGIMNTEKKYSLDSKLIFFKEVYDWITKKLVICTPETSITNLAQYCSESTLDEMTNLIKAFDTGISNISIEPMTMEELSNELPKKVFEKIREKVDKAIESDDEESMFSMRFGYSFFNLEYKKGAPLKITTIKMKHGESFYSFKFGEESDGTRRLFELIDMLLDESNNKVYVIDEMERSLHPKLLYRFIELFNSVHKDKAVQLIFTTHESSIMDQALFRRDEIWFVERDNDNNSDIYSLDKFKERYDRKLNTNYLEGRYGAIPVFSAFEFDEE